MAKAKKRVKMKDGGEAKKRATKMTAKDVPVGKGMLGKAKKKLMSAEERRQAAIKAAGG